jgi:adenosylhomocysteine nucleosidase
MALRDLPAVERIAIFAALQWECRPVLRHLQRVTRERHAHATVWRGRAAAGEVWLVKTGIGMALADVAARAVGNLQRFDLMVSTGCAGALAPELMPGDLAVASAIVGNGGEHFATDTVQRERFGRVAERAALRFTDGPVLCSPHVLATAADKRSAAARGPIAVEMEGAPIAAYAAQAGTAFVSVRAILDAADTELQHDGRVIDPQSGAVKPLALVRYLTTHPAAVTDLLAVQRMMKAAQTSLGKVFGAWLGGAL